jgi:hypothetical protein
MKKQTKHYGLEQQKALPNTCEKPIQWSKERKTMVVRASQERKKKGIKDGGQTSSIMYEHLSVQFLLFGVGDLEHEFNLSKNRSEND